MKIDLTRRSLVGATLAISTFGVFGAHADSATEADNALSVGDFRLPKDLDDTAAFERAIATRRPVYAPAGGGKGSNGVYLVRDAALIAGTNVFGDGIGKTVMRPSGNEAVFHCDSGSAAARIVGIQLRQMTLEGWVVKRGFAEHRHLLHVNGVQDVLIENVEFKGFQGDGLCLGSGRQSGVIRHNRGVTIRGCVFDGVNNNNRNGISVIDGEQILIEDCTFKNCTRPNMPGAIDFEPDATTTAIIRDIIIRRCRFLNVGGNVAAISFHIPPQVIAFPRQILISDNVFTDYRGSGGEIYLNINRAISARAPSMDVLIKGNRGTGGRWVYTFYAVKGVVAVGNQWQNYKNGSMIGYIASNQLARNVKVTDEFTGCGQSNGVGIYIFNAAIVAMDGCRLIDCGNGSVTSYGICFSRGKSEFITLTGLYVRSPTGKTHVAVIRDQHHSLSPGTNVQNLNDFGALPAIDISKPV